MGDKKKQPPAILPPDFDFGQKAAPATLPPDFDFGEKRQMVPQSVLDNLQAQNNLNDARLSPQPFDPRAYVQQRIASLQQEAQNQQNQYLGPEGMADTANAKGIVGKGASYMRRFGHGIASLLPETAAFADKAVLGATEWKNAIPIALGAINPLIPAAYFGAQSTINLPKSGSAAIQNPTPENVQNALSDAAMVTGAAGAARLPGKQSVPLDKATAVENVNRSLNANPKDMPGIRANLDSQLDTIIQNAKSKGIVVNNKADLIKAIDDAAKNDPYRKTFIEPFRDEWAAVPPSYKGGTVAQGSHATIGQLDARLSQINDTLFPKFNKGGSGSMAAQASIGSEQAASLNAEAVAIRKTISDTVGKKMGIDPEIVYNSRRNFSQLKKLAEDAQLSLDYSNRPTQSGIPLSKQGIIGRAIDEMYYRPRADRTIRKTFQDYQPGESNIDSLRRALADRTSVSGPTPAERLAVRTMMAKLKNQ